MRNALRLSAFAGAALMAAVAVQASIIPQDPVRTGTGPYTWSYPAVLSVNSQIQSGDGFTIYDFGAYVPGSVFAPAGWTASVSLTTAPPPGVALLIPDSGSVENLNFTYTGATVVNLDPVNGLLLGNFGAQSTQIDKTYDLSAYQNHDNSDPSGTVATGQNVIIVPVVPEPASLGLLALGSLGLLARRRTA